MQILVIAPGKKQTFACRRLLIWQFVNTSRGPQYCCSPVLKSRFSCLLINWIQHFRRPFWPYSFMNCISILFHYCLGFFSFSPVLTQRVIRVNLENNTVILKQMVTRSRFKNVSHNRSGFSTFLRKSISKILTTDYDFLLVIIWHVKINLLLSLTSLKKYIHLLKNFKKMLLFYWLLFFSNVLLPLFSFF